MLRAFHAPHFTLTLQSLHPHFAGRETEDEGASSCGGTQGRCSKEPRLDKARATLPPLSALVSSQLEGGTTWFGARGCPEEAAPCPLWDKGDPGSRMGALRHTFSPWRPGSDPQGPGQEPDPHAVCLRLPSPHSEAPRLLGWGWALQGRGGLSWECVQIDERVARNYLKLLVRSGCK